MKLNRLLVRDKLNLLAIAPLLAIIVTTVPLLAVQVQAARESTGIADRLAAGAHIAVVAQDLGRERLLSVAYIAMPDASPGSLVLLSQTVRDEVAESARALGTGPNRRLVDGLAELAGLEPLRREVLLRAVPGDAVDAAFSERIKHLVDTVGLTGSGPEGSLLALLRADERATGTAATMLTAVATPGTVDAAIGALSGSEAVETEYLSDFNRLASTGQRELFDRALQGSAAGRVNDIRTRFLGDPKAFVASAPPATLVPDVFDAFDAGLGVRRIASDTIATGLAGEAARAERVAVATATVFGVLTVGMVIMILALSVMASRSVSRPLRRLTVAADRVAELTNTELVRVADEEGDEPAPPRLAAVDLRSDDEIGDLAAAINRVQAVAALLLERQVASRLNVGVMFGNVGRRTQRLVGRQLALIDALERNEQSAELLERLYRLDHLTTRLRRYANSLLVLSGTAESQLAVVPVPVVELVRAALGEIEDFRRVELGRFDPILVRPEPSTDVALLIAELLENATSFSSPTTNVDVSATPLADGCLLVIKDHGIGMSAQQLATENQRMVRRERLDIAPTDVLGLFVVGRLARRHAITVRLNPTTGGGITAEVVLPSTLLARESGPVVEVELTTPFEPAPASTELHELTPPVGDRPVATVATIDRATSLQRRVRGAQLPETDRTQRPSGEPAGSPEDARALVEHIESGIRLAEESVAGQSLAEDFQRQARSVLDTLAAISERVPVGEHLSWFGKQPEAGGSVLAAEPAAPPPPPGTAGLKRRVRGATLPAEPMPTFGRSPLVRIGRPDDPLAARELVREFEEGIERATRETSAERTDG